MTADRSNSFALCEEYVHMVWCMEELQSGGIHAVYGMEQHCVELHEKLCDLLGIGHEKSKDVSYLDEKIGLDFSKTPSDSGLRNYAEKLLGLLESEKKKGSM